MTVLQAGGRPSSQAVTSRSRNLMYLPIRTPGSFHARHRLRTVSPFHPDLEALGTGWSRSAWRLVA